jgi:hypothetical protein
MYLYELAIRIEKRSGDLVTAAEQLGFGTLIAASEITDEQAQALSVHLTGRPVITSGFAPGIESSPPGGAPTGAPSSPGPAGGPRFGGLASAAIAVAVVVLLGAGATLLVGSRHDEMDERMAARARADAAEDGTDGEVPPEVAAKALKTIQLCDAAQQIADIDEQSDALMPDRPNSEEELRAGTAQVLALIPELEAAYGQLRQALPSEQHANVDTVVAYTKDLTARFAAAQDAQQLADVARNLDPVQAAEAVKATLALDKITRAECDIIIAER